MRLATVLFFCSGMLAHFCHAQESKTAAYQSVPDEYKLLIKFSDQKYSLEDLLKYARQLRDNAEEMSTRSVLGEYVRILTRMAKKNAEKDEEKNEIRKLIKGLKDQRDFEFFMTTDKRSSASKILNLGKTAIPYLIDEIENDDFTRSVGVMVGINGKLPPPHVLRVGDCACGMLRELTGVSYGTWYIHGPKAKESPKDIRKLYKKWWDEQGK